MLWPVHRTYTRWRDDADGRPVATLVDSRLPVHWAILETVADRVCAWTGHRLCYRWPVSSVLLTAGDHAETFEVAVSVELAERYHAWRGWDRPVWLEIHEEEG